MITNLHLLYFAMDPLKPYRQWQTRYIIYLSDKVATIVSQYRNVPRFPHVFEAYDIEEEDINDEDGMISHLQSFDELQFLELAPSQEEAFKMIHEYCLIMEVRQEINPIWTAEELLKLKKMKEFI